MELLKLECSDGCEAFEGLKTDAQLTDRFPRCFNSVELQKMLPFLHGPGKQSRPQGLVGFASGRPSFLVQNLVRALVGN